MADDARPSMTLSILESYFGRTANLTIYLSELLDLSGISGGTVSDYLVRESDSSTYRTLMNTTLVATKEPTAGKQRFKAYPPMMYMRDLIDKAQEILFSKPKGFSNIVTTGYRMSSKTGDGGKRGMTRMGVTNYFVNTIVTALKGSQWETLLERIGVDAMLHLLIETSIFVSLPNECLCQMTGEPLIYMPPKGFKITVQKADSGPEISTTRSAAKRKALDPHEFERPNKRRRLHDSAIAGSTAGNSGAYPTRPPLKLIKKITPADICLIRVRLFYARPVHAPHKNHFVVGLPPTHVLNRFNPSYFRKPKVSPEEFTDLDPRIQAEHARHLAKYVFSRQFGLSNVFDIPARPGKSTYAPNFVDMESAIQAKGACKTPKRLKDVLILLEKLIWRHGKCGYKPLRDKACPSKIKSEGAQPLDSSVILEMMSERSIQLRTQPGLVDANTSVDSSGYHVTAHGLSQAEKHTKHKPRFAEFACSHSEVYCYAVLVTKAVIPTAFWGNSDNFKLVLSHIKTFISCRRYENMTLHNILQGFSTSACEWLMPPGEAAKKQSRVPVTDALKRRELLEEFVYWYFSSFLLPLLKTTFYVTESSAFRNRVLYFRHDDWHTLCAPLIDRLTSATFEKMSQSEAGELLRQRKLGFSFVRLLPKDTGVRPIVNLRRKVAKNAFGHGQLSINQILQAAFQVLTYEKHAQPELLGASVFGSNEVYQRLKAFKSRLLTRQSSGLPKLYFVKVDVQACFDSIEQTKLLEILRELISEDAYITQRYGQVNSTAGRVQRKFVKKALPEDDHPHFLEYVAELANALRGTIFVDQVVYPFSRKQEILQLLEEHITENIVKIGHDFFRQIVGIPQGSVLSTLLCSFFYGDLEKKFKFREDPGSSLFRLVDDYLFITTSLTKAKSFLDMMHKGHPEYGCFISKDKTLTNFDYDAQVMNVTGPQQLTFPWCGYLINMKDLSVSTDYSRYHGNCLQDSLSVEKRRRPGAAFLQKMLLQVKLRSHIIYSDTHLNSEHIIYLNIYQNFMLTAMKMHQYIRAWGISITKSSKFIKDTVRQMISFAYATITNKANSKVAKLAGGRCNIQKGDVIWLGNHAIHAVLSRKAPKYSCLLKYLAFELSLPRARRSRKRFRGVVKEALKSISLIAY